MPRCSCWRRTEARPADVIHRSDSPSESWRKLPGKAAISGESCRVKCHAQIYPEKARKLRKAAKSWTQDLQHETQYQPEEKASCPCLVGSSLIRPTHRGCIASLVVFVERSWLVRITKVAMLGIVSDGSNDVYDCCPRLLRLMSGRWPYSAITSMLSDVFVLTVRGSGLPGKRYVVG